MKKIIAIGSDHAGIALRVQLTDYLTSRGIECIDCGCPEGTTADYPVIAAAVCSKITCDTATAGVLICGTGIGISIAANKHKGIRAGLCMETYSAAMTRQHNDANVLCLGARVTGSGLAQEILATFLDTDFEGGRHQARVDMIKALDS